MLPLEHAHVKDTSACTNAEDGLFGTSVDRRRAIYLQRMCALLASS